MKKDIEKMDIKSHMTRFGRATCEYSVGFLATHYFYKLAESPLKILNLLGCQQYPTKHNGLKVVINTNKKSKWEVI